jgi:DNA-binding transcriptional LysR family regulator
VSAVAEYMTPPEAGKLLRMKADRIITLIRSGELKASNIATRLSGRPRFRIAAADLADFLERRAAAAISAPTPRRRRKKKDRPAGWISYYAMEK